MSLQKLSKNQIQQLQTDIIQLFQQKQQQDWEEQIINMLEQLLGIQTIALAQLSPIPVLRMSATICSAYGSDELRLQIIIKVTSHNCALGDLLRLQSKKLTDSFINTVSEFQYSLRILRCSSEISDHFQQYFLSRSSLERRASSIPALLINQIGQVPIRGESTQFTNYLFEIIEYCATLQEGRGGLWCLPASYSSQELVELRICIEQLSKIVKINNVYGTGQHHVGVLRFIASNPLLLRIFLGGQLGLFDWHQKTKLNLNPVTTMQMYLCAVENGPPNDHLLAYNYGHKLLQFFFDLKQLHPYVYVTAVQRMLQLMSVSDSPVINAAALFVIGINDTRDLEQYVNHLVELDQQMQNGVFEIIELDLTNYSCLSDYRNQLKLAKYVVKRSETATLKNILLSTLWLTQQIVDDCSQDCLRNENIHCLDCEVNMQIKKIVCDEILNAEVVLYNPYPLQNPELKMINSILCERHLTISQDQYTSLVINLSQLIEDSGGINYFKQYLGQNIIEIVTEFSDTTDIIQSIILHKLLFQFLDQIQAQKKFIMCYFKIYAGITNLVQQHWEKQDIVCNTTYNSTQIQIFYDCCIASESKYNLLNAIHNLILHKSKQFGVKYLQCIVQNSNINDFFKSLINFTIEESLYHGSQEIAFNQFIFRVQQKQMWQVLFKLLQTNTDIFNYDSIWFNDTLIQKLLTLDFQSLQCNDYRQYIACDSPVQLPQLCDFLSSSELFWRSVNKIQSILPDVQQLIQIVQTFISTIIEKQLNSSNHLESLQIIKWEVKELIDLNEYCIDILDQHQPRSYIMYCYPYCILLQNLQLLRYIIMLLLNYLVVPGLYSSNSINSLKSYISNNKLDDQRNLLFSLLNHICTVTNHEKQYQQCKLYKKQVLMFHQLLPIFVEGSIQENTQIHYYFRSLIYEKILLLQSQSNFKILLQIIELFNCYLENFNRFDIISQSDSKDLQEIYKAVTNAHDKENDRNFQFVLLALMKNVLSILIFDPFLKRYAQTTSFYIQKHLPHDFCGDIYMVQRNRLVSFSLLFLECRIETEYLGCNINCAHEQQLQEYYEETGLIFTPRKYLLEYGSIESNELPSCITSFLSLLQKSKETTIDSQQLDYIASNLAVIQQSGCITEFADLIEVIFTKCENQLVKECALSSVQFKANKLIAFNKMILIMGLLCEFLKDVCLNCLQLRNYFDPGSIIINKSQVNLVSQQNQELKFSEDAFELSKSQYYLSVDLISKSIIKVPDQIQEESDELFRPTSSYQALTNMEDSRANRILSNPQSQQQSRICDTESSKTELSDISLVNQIKDQYILEDIKQVPDQQYQEEHDDMTSSNIIEQIVHDEEKHQHIDIQSKLVINSIQDTCSEDFSHHSVVDDIQVSQQQEKVFQNKENEISQDESESVEQFEIEINNKSENKIELQNHNEPIEYKEVSNLQNLKLFKNRHTPQDAVSTTTTCLTIVDSCRSLYVLLGADENIRCLQQEEQFDFHFAMKLEPALDSYKIRTQDPKYIFIPKNAQNIMQLMSQPITSDMDAKEQQKCYKCGNTVVVITENELSDETMMVPSIYYCQLLQRYFCRKCSRPLVTKFITDNGLQQMIISSLGFELFQASMHKHMYLYLDLQNIPLVQQTVQAKQFIAQFYDLALICQGLQKIITSGIFYQDESSMKDQDFSGGELELMLQTCHNSSVYEFLDTELSKQRQIKTLNKIKTPEQKMFIDALLPIQKQVQTQGYLFRCQQIIKFITIHTSTCKFCTQQLKLCNNCQRKMDFTGIEDIFKRLQNGECRKCGKCE